MHLPTARKYKSLFLLLPLLTAYNGASGQSQTSATTSSAVTNKIKARKILLSSSYEVPVQLGDGFDSRTGMGLGLSCLVNAGDAGSVVLSNPQGSIDFTNTTSIGQVSSILNTNVEGSANFGVFSASVAAKYVRDSMDTRQTLHFNYLQSMAANATFTVKGLGNNILSTDAQDILANGENYFTNVCGDSIVQSAKQGAVLVVDVSIQFANAALKEKFEGSAKGSIFGIGSISGAFSNETSSSTQNANLAVKAYQVGGDPTKLANIFGKPNPQGQYNIVECSAKNVNACQNIINDIVAYAQKDFQTNVNFSNPNSLYTYEYNTKLYSKYGVKAVLPVLTAEQKAAREYLTDSITEDRKVLAYLKTYQMQPFYPHIVDPVSKDYIVKAINDYTTMISSYNNFNIIDSCYGDTENINTRCVYAANEVKTMRAKYQSSIAFSSQLTHTILFNSPAGSFRLVFANGYCDDSKDECVGGIFAIYNAWTGVFSDKNYCMLDMSTDNKYFNTYHSSLSGKSLWCYGEIINGAFYVNRALSLAPNAFGIAGRVVNNQQVNFDVPPYGYNTQFFYSGVDLKHNPI